VQDVSAVIVTHNSEAVIGACLDALSGCGEVIASGQCAGGPDRRRSCPAVLGRDRGECMIQGVWLAHSLALVRS